MSDFFNLQFSIHEKSRGTEYSFIKIILLYHLICYITRLDATLETRPLRQAYCFLETIASIVSGKL